VGRRKKNLEKGKKGFREAEMLARGNCEMNVIEEEKSVGLERRGGGEKEEEKRAY